MKEFSEMTDEELNTIITESSAEIKKRQAAKKKAYNDRYCTLCEIEKAFEDYCYKFNGELPYMKLAGVNDEPI